MLHVKGPVAWKSTCDSVRELYHNDIERQVEFVCGDANQARNFRPGAHKVSRTEQLGNARPELLNGITSTVARFAVSQKNANINHWEHSIPPKGARGVAWCTVAIGPHVELGRMI